MSTSTALDGATRTPVGSPLIQLRNVTKHFPIRKGVLLARQVGAVQAVDNVTLDVMRGETIGIVGETGCGKSTTARLIVRLLDPTSGEIIFDGHKISDYSGERLKALRREMQMIFQDPYSSLNPRKTVGSIISDPFIIHGLLKGPGERKQRVQELMDRVGLNPEHYNRYPHEFSGGQRQRIGVARALALQPKVLVADEPVSALDVSIQAGIVQLFADLRSRLGVTIFFIAHDLAVVRHLCDRVAVMYMGKIVEQGTTSELFANPRHPYTRALLDSIPRLQPDAHEEVVAPEGEPPSLARLPSGCRFRSRCPFATEKCESEEPGLLVVTTGAADSSHLAACHYANDLEAYVGRSTAS